MNILLLCLSLLLFCLPAISEPFIDSQSIDVKFSGEITGLTASADNKYIAVHDNYSQHHLITLGNTITGTLISLNDSENNETIDTFEQVIWLENELALINRDNFTVIEPEDMSVKLSSDFDLRSSGRYISWSNKYQMLVIDTQLYDKQGVQIKHSKADSNKQHATQSGQLINEDNNIYISSGFHSQDIFVWSLPDGKLMNEWVIGHWYSSRKITDISTLNNQLFVASKGGKIELRSLVNADVLWSFSACNTKPYFASGINNKLFYRCDNELGYIENINNKWQNFEINIKQNHSAQLTSVSQTNNPDTVALCFSDGGAIVYDLISKKVIQVLLSHETGPETDPAETEINKPAYVSYLDKRKQLIAINQQGILRVFNLID